MEDAISRLIVVDSITDLRSEHRGAVTVTGSHGGRYPGAFAHDIGVSGAVFSDAGIGLDDAGIAGLDVLQRSEIPAAAASAETCRIGDGQDVFASGRISTLNDSAAAIGIVIGQPVEAAATAMVVAARARTTAAVRVSTRSLAGTTNPTADTAEKRTLHTAGPLRVWILDSASLVTPEDSGSIVVTGSHGGAPGGEPARALKCSAFLAAFNDAGMGKESAGIGRLSLLEGRGIPAVTVSADTARIGNGASTFADGMISAANPAAAQLGAIQGRRLAHVVDDLLAGYQYTRK